MSMQTIEIERTSPAGVDAVWELLADSASWPSWTPIDRHVEVSPGDDDGVGEIRVFETGRRRVREEILERRAPLRLAYELRAGLAVRDYRAEVDLAPAGEGTRIRWQTRFKSAVPGTGWLYRREIAKATESFVEGLSAAAAGR
jgi:uncharacterized protein YndB with AHSA1/START domain